MVSEYFGQKKVLLGKESKTPLGGEVHSAVKGLKALTPLKVGRRICKPYIKGHIGSTPLKTIHIFLTSLQFSEYLVDPPKKYGFWLTLDLPCQNLYGQP